MENSNKVGYMKSRLVAMLAVALMGGVPAINGVASADALTTATTGNTSSINKTATQQAHLQNIISKGDQEIERRLTTLNSLTGKINAATHLSASDKSALTNEVSTTTSGLTSLKTQLDGETTVSAAAADAKNIYTEYRVYALVAPKVNLIKVADDQQVVEGKLTALAQKLQTRITAEQQVGKDVSALQSELNDMNSKANAAQSISSNIESSVINLQPSDYNSNHAVLSGDNTQLKSAHSDNLAARTDAKNIVSTLKTM